MLRFQRTRLVAPIVWLWLLPDSGLVGPLAAQDAPTPAVAAEPAPTVSPQLLGQPVAEFQARRRALMERVLEAELQGGPADAPGALFGVRRNREPIVILRGADDPSLEGAFRQTNDFAYLTGVEVPSAVLVLFPDRQEEMLYLPPGGAHGDPLGPGHPGPGASAAGALGVARVESTERFLSDLLGAVADPLVRSRAGSAATLYVLDPEDDARDGPERRLIRLLREAAPNTRFRDAAPLIHAMRKIKSEAELALLRRAIAVTGAAQRAVLESIRPGQREYVLKGEILGTFLKGGAERAGFPSIVGSGPNATIPHYFGSLRELQDGDLVVVDIGAEVRHYTADITRTVPVSGSFTPRQRELYQLVLDAQRAVEAEMKPGVTHLSAMTGFVREFFDRSPLRAVDDDGQERPMGHFFIHGLGHFLGMDVHDVGRANEPVQVGEVFTIEPGLYIPTESLGIRIEDDYLMTEDGPLKLSADIPSDPETIERLIAEARDGP